jgi:hypothetical protein
MDEQSPKSIKISNFFNGTPGSTTGVKVRKSTDVKSPILMSGSDFAAILGIIQTETEVAQAEKEKVLVLNKEIIRENQKDDRDAARLQAFVNSLTFRVNDLSNQLSGFMKLIFKDLEDREKETRNYLKQVKVSAAERSKRASLQKVESSISEVSEGGKSLSQGFEKERSDEQYISKLFGTAAIAATAFGLNADDKPNNEYMGKDEAISNPVQALQIYNYLISKGVEKYHAIGMVNNIYHESSFNSGAYVIDSNGKPSGGLFQHNGPRFTSMVKYVGKGWQKNWQKQIDFALTEAQYKEYQGNKYTSSEDASVGFTLIFEIPDNANSVAKQRLKTIKSIEKIINNSPTNKANPNSKSNQQASAASATSSPTSPSMAMNTEQIERNPEMNQMAAMPSAMLSDIVSDSSKIEPTAIDKNFNYSTEDNVQILSPIIANTSQPSSPPDYAVGTERVADNFDNASPYPRPTYIPAVAIALNIANMVG